MRFTKGKDRFYEDMMQEKPGFSKDKSHKQRDGSFKHTYAGIDCRYCISHKSCRSKLCPHIMENLNELRRDEAFREAVVNAEDCKTAQRGTLIYIKKHRLCV